MLPFPKRKAKEDEIVELADEDLVLVDAPPSSRPSARLAANASAHGPLVAAQAPAPRAERRDRPSRPFSRKAIDDRLEDDVIGECLASISASTMRVRSLTPLTLPPPPSSRHASAPSSSSMAAARLPALSAPPFARGSIGERQSQPVFARTPAPPSSSAASFGPASTPSLSSAPAMSSIAPSATTLRPPAEPTVILVRERPRAGWVVASAIVGAACAVIATRMLTAGAPSAPPAAAAVAPPPPRETTVVVAAPARPAEPAPAVAAVPPPPVEPAPALTVKFSDDEGVAFPAPQAAPAPHAPGPFAPTSPFSSGAAPASKPRPKVDKEKPKTGPMLPDGSYSLAAAPTAAPSAAVSAASQPASATTSAAAPKKPLSPEQELAAAQLKASMK